MKFQFKPLDSVLDKMMDIYCVDFFKKNLKTHLFDNYMIFNIIFSTGTTYVASW